MQLTGNLVMSYSVLSTYPLQAEVAVFVTAEFYASPQYAEHQPLTHTYTDHLFTSNFCARSLNF